jgi:hypothetical protein
MLSYLSAAKGGISNVCEERCWKPAPRNNSFLHLRGSRSKRGAVLPVPSSTSRLTSSMIFPTPLAPTLLVCSAFHSIKCRSPEHSSSASVGSSDHLASVTSGTTNHQFEIVPGQEEHYLYFPARYFARRPPPPDSSFESWPSGRHTISCAETFCDANHFM